MYKFIIFLVFGIGVISYGNAQINLTGPECVVPGIEYQYAIKKAPASLTSIKICINGGTLSGNSDSCWVDSALTVFRIIWNENISNGNITLNSGLGNTVKKVSITKKLFPGLLADSSREQTINFNSIPAEIICSPAEGGGCSNLYEYQWLKSLDNVSWKSINGAITENLIYKLPMHETTYFRRKVTNTISNTTAYSPMAAVFVKPEDH